MGSFSPHPLFFLLTHTNYYAQFISLKKFDATMCLYLHLTIYESICSRYFVAQDSFQIGQNPSVTHNIKRRGVTATWLNEPFWYIFIFNRCMCACVCVCSWAVCVCYGVRVTSAWHFIFSLFRNRLIKFIILAMVQKSFSLLFHSLGVCVY